VGEKPSKRHKIPFQDLPNGRFLCLRTYFTPIADLPAGVNKFRIPRDSFFMIFSQSTPVKNSQPTTRKERLS
jgi:hypothetical protein